MTVTYNERGTLREHPDFLALLFFFFFWLHQGFSNYFICKKAYVTSAMKLGKRKCLGGKEVDERQKWG